MDSVLLSTELDLPCIHRGKVRDVYSLGDQLLFVATDRLSAFDVVFNEGIPRKGEVLTYISHFWSERLPAAQPFHAITTSVQNVPVSAQWRQRLAGRSMLVEQLTMVPVECVVRSRLVGSSWKDYQRTGAVCGHTLPAGMQLGDPLPELLFTPATKAQQGAHDENISIAEMIDQVGEDTAKQLQERSLELFTQARDYAAERGLVLVDTKLEFGFRTDGTLVLADEIFTPDSSRYWDLEQTEATPRGQTPPSFDKQIVRDYLETLSWNKQPPPPALPPHIVSQTSQRYLELVERLTGEGLPAAS